MRTNTAEKILADIETRYIPEPNTGCWIWLGWINKKDGYARIKVNGKPRVAHLVLYELKIGPVPEGKQLDHLCRNRWCVNYENHLEPVTCQINLLRGETLAAKNAAKTHCSKGHELSNDNLVKFALSRGERRCHTCFLETKRRGRARAKLIRASKDRS